MVLLNELAWIKYLGWCLTHKKCYINVYKYYNYYLVPQNIHELNIVLLLLLESFKGLNTDTN